MFASLQLTFSLLHGLHRCFSASEKDSFKRLTFIQPMYKPSYSD